MPTAQSTSQQLVVFDLANEEYGIAITQVQEIIRHSDITRIPGMPNFIEGVINLRGRIIPVIDLRKRFGLDLKAVSEETRIVVADAGDQTIGLVVDSVSEVINLTKDQIDPIPPTISAIDADYLSGVGKLEKRIVVLLDLAKLLGDLERAALLELSKKEKPGGHGE
ncbi:MAG: chemotaxis protein CheW [Endomicrobiales bacterium]|nr:chemotaxis protein CheW [Endomicrobiales bacterium]